MHLPPKTREKDRVELGIFGAVIGLRLYSHVAFDTCDKETFKG